MEKNPEADVRIPIPTKEVGQAYRVVMKLLQGLEEKRHSVVMDNFFCSISLFKDLILKEIYATGIVRSSCVGLPSHLKNIKSWKKCHG